MRIWFVRPIVFHLALLLAAGSATGASLDVRLPSDSTGGGTLAVRVSFPDTPAAFRYGATGGAPVVVISPGGFGAGSLESTATGALLEQGFVTLTFFYPGGGPPGIGSDGSYDERGDASQRALRDVLRFATGETTDSQGRSLGEITGGTVRGDLAGILALSNGGSIAITTLGRYGGQIPPLAFLVGWECPTSDQVLGGELGSHDLDPDPGTDADGDGITDNDVVNGAYLSYGFPRLQMDYDRLRYDPGATLLVHGEPAATGLFFFDNDGDGVYSVSPAGVSDMDGNGRLDADEDFPLPGIVHTDPDTGTTRFMLSRPATAHAAEAGLAVPWPEHYASAAAAEAYWSIRDAAELFPAAMASQPSLAGMSLFGARDHVQSTRDHAHVHHWVDGFRRAGHWHRLNPDRSYVESVGHGRFPNARDNDANLEPSPSEMELLAEPVGVVPQTVLLAAGVAEMADRAASGIWDDNLDGVIESSGQPDTASHLVTFAINCHDWVNPRRSAETVGFVLDTLEAAGARAELYVTAPVVAAWQAEAPELIERLRHSDHTISYHVRPPHPAAFPPTRELLDTTPLADFETYWQDLSTGELDRSRPGGYTLVAQVFGRRPNATGLGGSDAELNRRLVRITTARGARVAVFHHGPVEGRSGFEDLALPDEGAYPRPNDHFVARVDENGHPSDGDFWWNRVASGQLSPEALAEVFRRDFLDREPGDGDGPLFSVVVIHENNFYLTGTPWRPVYYDDPDGQNPKEAPWDLGTTAPWVSERPPEETERIRAAFQALVRAAAGDGDTAIVTSEDIASMGDALFSAQSDPIRTVEWLTAGDLETDPPPGYQWTGSAPAGGGQSGELAVTEEAAATGKLGLRIEATGTFSAQKRVDIDKGQTYRFGASLRGYHVGSVRLVLQPVGHSPSGLVPVGPGFSTTTLSGDFSWTTVEGTAHLTSNHDYVLLEVAIEGGGIVDLDDAHVSSTEHRPLAYPAATPAPVLITTLIHVENVPDLTTDSSYFRAKRQLLDDLGAIFHRHGAVLTVQPEMELLTGLESLDPGFIRHLRNDYGCAFSVHTHGPQTANPSVQDVLDYVARRKRALESLGAGDVLDLNGNFDVTDWSVFSRAGIYSMTAFKNKDTQEGTEGRYFHPWRPSPGNPYTDEAAWAVDDPSSRVVYLPGNTTGITRYRDQLERKVLPGLSAALWNAEASRPTTWYFVTHVDFFSSIEGVPLQDYMDSDAYRKDLQAYDDLLSDILDPLVERGLVRWSDPNEMRKAFEDAVGAPHPWEPEALRPVWRAAP